MERRENNSRVECGGVGDTVVMPEPQTHLIKRYSITKMRFVASYLTLLMKIVVPVLIAVYYAWMKNQRSVVNSVRQQIVPAIFATITSKVSFTYISGAVNSSSSRIDPLLKSIREIKLRPAPQEATELSSEPEKSVKCDVLYDPGTPIRADIIFIHGLHGSLEKTWKQGLWDHNTVKTVKMRRDRDVSSENYNVKESPCILEECDISIKNRDDIDEDYLVSDVDDDDDEEDDEEILDASDLAAVMNDICKDEEPPRTTPQEDSYSKCWPRDWLPLDCPGVRVIALNYTTEPFLWRPFWVTKRNRPWSTSNGYVGASSFSLMASCLLKEGYWERVTGMLERSREMTAHLLDIGVGSYPIVWVGHSKGGIFVKQILVDAHKSSRQAVSRICRNTKGIMFYSVPHRGSSCADINLPLLRQSIELTEVQKECHKVLELHAQFLKLLEEGSLQVEVFSFIETVQTFMSILYIQIVTAESADLGMGEFLGVPVDHRNICKPTSRKCFLYKELADLINRTV